MAGMKVTIPGASQNTGVKKSTAYPSGKYTLLINNAVWDDSRAESAQEYSLRLETAIVDGPCRDDGSSVVGGKFTYTLRYRFGDDVEQWKMDNDLTAIVAVFVAAQLKIVKDMLPVDKLAGRSVVAHMSQRSYEKDGETRTVNDVKKFEPAEDGAE